MFNIEYVITVTIINIVLSIINTFTIVITFIIIYIVKSVWLCTAIELFIILPPTDAFKTYVLYIGNYKLRTVVCQY